MKYKRKKAFWGAVAGAAASLIGGTISSIMNANAQKKQQEEQERAQREQNNLTTAANLANAINGSQDAADSYYDRLSLFKCGGRKRVAWGTQDTNDLIGGITKGLGSVVNSAVANNAVGNVQTVRQAPVQFQPKQLVMPSYYSRIQPSQYVFKNGGMLPVRQMKTPRRGNDSKYKRK